MDIGYVRLPVDQRGLELEPLFSEPRVAVVPADHRLADKDAVAVADLTGEHLLQDPDAVPEWRDIAVELRGRQRRVQVPPLRSVEEKLEHVAAGHGIVVLPLSTATFYTRPDLSYVSVGDVAANQVCLAWDSLGQPAPERPDPGIRRDCPRRVGAPLMPAGYQNGRTGYWTAAEAAGHAED
ncbi:MAG TPA: LysR family transcriptional regulator substrate-binding protein [Trebonia sp.]